MANTAIAAEKVLKDEDKSQAAVCSAYAAKIHGLTVLSDNINDNEHNSTRFIVVTNQKIFLKHASKISICLEVSHESGSLYRVLSHFIYNDLNMTKIESRPIEGRAVSYTQLVRSIRRCCFRCRCIAENVGREDIIRRKFWHRN